MAEIIRADEQNFPGGFEETGELVFCHLSKEEAKAYDFLQDPTHKGHPSIDEETQLRSYEPFGELIKEKEFRDLFLNMDKEWDKEDAGYSVPEEMHHLHARGTNEINDIAWSPAPGDSDPEIKKLAKKGKGKDSIIVRMPENVVYFFGVINDGEISVNPLTNFPQFGGKAVKEVVRTGTTVVGAVIGGHAGAAVGSVVGSALTGRKPRDWAPQALKSAALTDVAHAGINAFAGTQLPSLTGKLISGTGNMLGNMFAGNMFGGNQGQSVDNAQMMNMPGGQQSQQYPQPWGKMTSWQNSAGGNMMPSFSQPASHNNSNMLSSFFQSPILPAGLNIFAGIMKRNADKEKYKNELAERREEEARNDERIEQYKRRSGYYEPLKLYPTYEKRWDEKKGRYIHKGDTDFEYDVPHYAHGGHVVEYKNVENGRLITGKGDGTSDSIYTKVPADTFIVNAFTVSSLGNGSSQAGEEAFQEWFKKIEKYFGSHAVLKYLKKNKSHKMVDVATSIGEIPIFPSHVYMIGYGNLEDGIKELEHLQKQVKEHRMKSTKGALPEEAHTIESYLKKGRD